jgi:hypothetical protein
MAPRKNAVAVSEGVSDKHMLGRLATYTLPDEGVNGTTLVRIWHQHGLDVNDLPKVRQPVHVFQMACRSVEDRRAANGGSKQVEVQVDQVYEDAKECVYQITRMVRDKANKVIEHPKAMRVTFNKDFATIDVEALEDYDALRGLEEQIRKHFEKNGKKIPGQKVRNAVRDQLLRLGAQNVRRKAGGLYFVPKEYRVGDAGETEPTKPVLDGLKGALTDAYGERADFYMIPVASDEGMKEMVRKHFTINVNEAAAELTQKALNRVRTGKGERGVRSDLLANLYNERRRLAASVRDFNGLVKLEQKEIKANLKDLDDALAKLQDLADAE